MIDNNDAKKYNKEATIQNTIRKTANLWADVLESEWKEAEHEGAKKINQHREIYLRNFAKRFDICL